jgi:hypothetical protein
MAQPRNSKPFDLVEQLKRIDEDYPVVAQDWYVKEVCPAQEFSGYYGENVPAKTVQTWTFASEEDWTLWLESHKPDKGNFFEYGIRKRRRVTSYIYSLEKKNKTEVEK